MQRDAITSVLSFLNCTKYPPSLEYLLMTLGPSILLLAFAERWNAKRMEPFIIFGRVPMFYYLLHIPLIHGMALVAMISRGAELQQAINPMFADHLRDYGYDLPGVYLFWILTILLLYPACRWYAGFKKRSTNPVWRYL